MQSLFLNCQIMSRLILQMGGGASITYEPKVSHEVILRRLLHDKNILNLVRNESLSAMMVTWARIALVARVRDLSSQVEIVLPLLRRSIVSPDADHAPRETRQVAHFVIEDPSSPLSHVGEATRRLLHQVSFNRLQHGRVKVNVCRSSGDSFPLLISTTGYSMNKAKTARIEKNRIPTSAQDVQWSLQFLIDSQFFYLKK